MTGHLKPIGCVVHVGHVVWVIWPNKFVLQELAKLWKLQQFFESCSQREVPAHFVGFAAAESRVVATGTSSVRIVRVEYMHVTPDTTVQGK